MIDANLQWDMFRAAKKAGQAAGFDIHSVVVLDDSIEYTWERSWVETLRHQFRAPVNEVTTARHPEALIKDIFLRETRRMVQFRDMHEQR